MGVDQFSIRRQSFLVVAFTWMALAGSVKAWANNQSWSGQVLLDPNRVDFQLNEGHFRDNLTILHAGDGIAVLGTSLFGNEETYQFDAKWFTDCRLGDRAFERILDSYHQIRQQAIMDGRLVAVNFDIRPRNEADAIAFFAESQTPITELSQREAKYATAGEYGESYDATVSRIGVTYRSYNSVEEGFLLYPYAYRVNGRFYSPYFYEACYGPRWGTYGHTYYFEEDGIPYDYVNHRRYRITQDVYVHEYINVIHDHDFDRGGFSKRVNNRQRQGSYSAPGSNHFSETHERVRRSSGNISTHTGGVTSGPPPIVDRRQYDRNESRRERRRQESGRPERNRNDNPSRPNDSSDRYNDRQSERRRTRQVDNSGPGSFGRRSDTPFGAGNLSSPRPRERQSERGGSFGGQGQFGGGRLSGGGRSFGSPRPSGGGRSGGGRRR